VIERCRKIVDELKGAGIRVHLDDRDQHTPGFKFNYWEQKGVPVRLNIGPKDVDKNVVEVARRDSGEKIRDVSQDGLAATIAALLVTVQQAIFDRALALRKTNTVSVSNYAEFKSALKEKNCFIEAYFAGSNEDELKIKEETKATVRAIPFDQPGTEGTCFYTGKPATKKVLLAIAY
jgi:prolyl-tRNA synthetase